MTSQYNQPDFGITARILRDWRPTFSRLIDEEKAERRILRIQGACIAVALIIAIYLSTSAIIALYNVERQIVAKQEIDKAELHYSITNNR